MAVEKAIRNYLLTKSAVTSLIGSGASARIWPDVVDQTWKVADGPCVTYEIIDSTEVHTLTDRTGFVSSRFSFCCYAGSRMSANATARAIKNCGIAAIKGLYSSVSIRGVEIESGIRTEVEKPDDGKASFRYLTFFDLMVHYLEE